MSRVEENRETLEYLVQDAERHKKGTFEEIASWHLGTMNTLLDDISRSLAIIADAKGGKNEGNN